MLSNPHSNGRKRTYYVPLTPPSQSDSLPTYDPRHLPLRAHDEWVNVTLEIQEADRVGVHKALAMDHGIKGMPALSRVGSLDYAWGASLDFMHLLFENVVKNMVNLWMGRFKNLDAGEQDYIIPSSIWKEIGEETVAAVKHIPSAFVRSLKNFVEDQSYFMAEGWGFWFIYLAPILLRDRFNEDVYYDHMCALVDIMKMCLQFTISSPEVDDLETRIIVWVKEYER